MRMKNLHPNCRCDSTRRLFITAFMVAAKYTRDDIRNTWLWRYIGQKLFCVLEINQMERELCRHLGWLLNIDPDDLCTFEAKVRNLFGSASPTCQDVEEDYGESVADASIGLSGLKNHTTSRKRVSSPGLFGRLGVMGANGPLPELSQAFRSEFHFARM
ncbi:hypothetical protein RSAG8_12064, partial [Rhizoctonia solani AG-8 WAC10335]